MLARWYIHLLEIYNVSYLYGHPFMVLGKGDVCVFHVSPNPSESESFFFGGAALIQIYVIGAREQFLLGANGLAIWSDV